MYDESFASHFGALTDARQSAKVTYPFEDILFITLCAVTAGDEGWSRCQRALKRKRPGQVEACMDES